MTTLEIIEIILMIVFAICFGVFFALWYKKREDYIELNGRYKAACKDRDRVCEVSKSRFIENDRLSNKVEELKKRLNAMPMQPYNVTRIECFQQPIKKISHIVEINPYEFSRMSDASIEDAAKKEVLKHIFEAAEPLVEFIVEDCPIEASRKFIGRLKVVEPYKEEANANKLS